MTALHFGANPPSRIFFFVQTSKSKHIFFPSIFLDMPEVYFVRKIDLSGIPEIRCRHHLYGRRVYLHRMECLPFPFALCHIYINSCMRKKDGRAHFHPKQIFHTVAGRVNLALASPEFPVQTLQRQMIVPPPPMGSP